MYSFSECPSRVSSTSVLTLYTLVVILSVVFHADCYSSGAPMTACSGGNPIHHTKASNRTEMYDPQPAIDNPFRFTADSTIYEPGESLRVTISGENGTVFRGFFLQARIHGTRTAVGEFTDPPALSQFGQCETPSDSVTHTGRDDKEALTFQWMAPNRCTGNITFIGSVALGHSTFYVDMTSSVITCKAGCLQVNIGVMVISLMVTLFYKTSE
ncbi:putative defense protein Hdd11 [Lytechinus variegatus]|uniref:putative defense protein Hdd11 n=1 Tax=Lytechinus variegatus TaxID=7654 RepID=UPI001BB1F9C2|nr:putative defense protein Hdd11 [Lytechinus variegatus]